MNWLDILLFAIVIFFALVGWQRGLVRQIFDVVGVVASYFVAIRYGNDFILWFTRYAPLTEWFPQLFNNPTPLGFDLGDVIIRLIGFALLFGIVSLLFRITGNIAHSVFSLPVLDIVNGFGGLLLGAIKGILLGFIMIGVASLISTPFLTRALEESSLAVTALSVLPVIYEQMMVLMGQGK